MLVDFVNGQTHYVKVTSDNFLNGNHTDPILCTIGSGLIVGFVSINVVFDFFLAEVLKKYFRGIIETSLPFPSTEYKPLSSQDVYFRIMLKAWQLPPPGLQAC